MIRLETMEKNVVIGSFDTKGSFLQANHYVHAVYMLPPRHCSCRVVVSQNANSFGMDHRRRARAVAVFPLFNLYPPIQYSGPICDLETLTRFPGVLG